MKRLLTGALALLISFAASATTFNPIQLLNPAGSVAGQAIVSTGPTTVATWGGVGVNGIAAIAANTVLANATGSSASPTAFAMPSCTTALEWVSGTGFVCNSAGAFTTLSASGLISPTSAIGIKGTTTNDNAQAGSIGEYIQSTVASGSAIGMSSGTPLNVTSISLTAGDWDVWGIVGFTPAGSTAISSVIAGISTTSATLPANPQNGSYLYLPLTFPTGTTPIAPVGQVRLSLSSTTTVYLVAQSAFSTSTNAAYGGIFARRMR